MYFYIINFLLSLKWYSHAAHRKTTTNWNFTSLYSIICMAGQYGQVFFIIHVNFNMFFFKHILYVRLPILINLFFLSMHVLLINFTICTSWDEINYAKKGYCLVQIVGISIPASDKILWFVRLSVQVNKMKKNCQIQNKDNFFKLKMYFKLLE